MLVDCVEGIVDYCDAHDVWLRLFQ